MRGRLAPTKSPQQPVGSRVNNDSNMLHDKALNSEIGALVISSRMWRSASRLPVRLHLSAGPRGCLPHLPGLTFVVRDSLHVATL